MAVAVAVSLGEVTATIAALVEQCRATRGLRPAGALAALSWLTGVSDRCPVSRVTRAANPVTVRAEAALAEQALRAGSGGAVPAVYAGGVLDAMLWALGRQPSQPLI